MNENFDAFDKYALTFDMNEKMIEYKYKHSYRVVHQAEEICRSINTDTEERDLASLIALLHDVARFRQWTNYKTLIDSKSFDHGDEAIKILFDENLIKEFIIKEDDKEILKKAIMYHNKFKVPFSELNNRESLHSKIIRDADKLDILYAFSNPRILELSEDDSEITEELEEAFFNHEQAPYQYVKTKNDSVIAKFALCYDLNFDYSKKRVLNEKYLDKMLNSLKNKKLFEPYVKELKRFLKGEE